MRSDALSCVLRVFAVVAALVALCLPSAALLHAVDVNAPPKPTGYVSDLAHVIDPADKDQLEAFCTRVEQELGVQFALVTIDSVGDQPIRDFALDLFRKWGVGDRKTNQGVLLLLAVRDRKNDVETGRGIEPYLTDGFSGGTLRAMRPQLQNSQYGPALLTAAQAMAAQIAQGKGVSFAGATLPPPEEPRREVTGRRSTGIPFSLIIFGIFFVIWLLGRGGRRGGGGGGSFLTGMLLGNILGGGGRSGGGGWGDGGGFGGGSGGGGGFGGFGGGDAGGGGASSNW